MTDLGSKSVPLTPQQQRLVLDSQGFARKATRFHAYKVRGTLAADDVRQLVNVALAESARSFDPTHGVAFASFAWQRVAGSVTRAAEDEASARDLVRQAVAACLSLQDGEVNLDEDAAAVSARAELMAARVATAAVAAVAGLVATEPVAANPEEAASAGELRGMMEAEVARLPERAQRVIGLYYGKGMPLKDVAGELGVSFATVRRDHDEALDKLREGIARVGVDGAG